MPSVRGELIRRLRKERGLSLRDLAQKLSLSHTYLSRIERNEQDPSLDTLSKIAQSLGVPVQELIHSHYPADDQPAKNTVAIPVLGRTHAGEPVASEEVLEEYLIVPVSTVNGSRSDSYFALRVVGDSMAPTIPDGSMVIVRRQPVVESGQIAVVQWADSWETHIRRVYMAGHRLILQPDNRRYQPIILTRPKVRILGRVLKVLVDLQDAAAVEPIMP